MPAENAAARLNRITLLKNIPLSAQLELTRRCPLACAHCYLPRGASAAGELTTAEWKRVMEGLAGLGCLSLVLTGGEPLLRPDLPALCAHATALGFELRVFTSGTGLTPALLRALRGCNISCFELSFYGRAAVHDGITSLPGSRRCTLAAARALKRAGFRVKLKTPFMARVAGELRGIARLARREGFAYAFDPVLTGSEDGARSNARLKLAPRRAAALAAALLPAPENTCPAPADPGSPPCGAGRNVVAVTACGEVRPCLQLPLGLGDVRRGLEKIWRRSPPLLAWRGKKVSDSKECRACPDLDWCSRCPGVALQETGCADKPYETACRLAAAARSEATRFRRSLAGTEKLSPKRRPVGHIKSV